VTPKEKRFVEEYLIDLNATQAAIRAGYSKKTAGNIASQNLEKLHIREAIDKAIAKRSERTEITQDMVLQEYARIGFANIADYMSWNQSGNDLKNSDDLTSDQTAAVQEVVYEFGDNSGKVKLKLHDKKGALDSMMRHLGGFEDKVAVTVRGRDEWLAAIKGETDGGNR